jgi:type I restriction enzyme S subunit
MKLASLRTRLPDSWKISKCSDVIDVRDGTHDTPKYVASGYPLVTSKNLRAGEIDFSTVSYISKEDHDEISKRSRVDRGDILFAMIGTIGNPVVVDLDAEFSIKNVALFKFSESPIDAKYFRYLLETQIIQQQLKAEQRGGTQQFVSLKALRNMLIPYPPLEEQRRIAAILDRAAAVRRNRQEAIALTEEFLRSTFLEMFGDPVTNSKGWEVKEFASLVSNKDSLRVPLKQADRASRQGIYPYYGASGVIDFIDDYLFDGEHLLIAEDGANLIARSTPVAFRASGRFWVNNHAHVVQDNGCADLCFLEHFFSLISLEPWITGSAQPKLNWGNLAQVPVPTPPRQLQEQFRIFSQRVSVAYDQMIESVDQQEILFNSLLQRAFNGKL